MTSTSEAKRICVVGSTGLVGYTLLEQAVSRQDVRMIGIARREVSLPPGARMEMLLADPAGWGDAIAAANARTLVCALGTTMRKAGHDEAAFRAIDHDLVLACARAAREAGIEHMIAVSSVGAGREAKSFYLRVKGEMEEAIAKIGLRRLDILRPSLIVGPRQEIRPLERIGMWLSPAARLFLHGSYRKYRPVRATILAQAVFALAHAKAAGRFVHEYDAIRYTIRRAGE